MRASVLCRLRSAGLQAASDARWLARRQEILARRQAGVFPHRIADDLGITAMRCQDWLLWAERKTGIGHGVRSDLPWLSGRVLSTGISSLYSIRG